MKSALKKFILLVSIVSTFGAIQAANAQVSFQLENKMLESSYTTEPGEVINDNITIINRSEEPIAVSIYPSDGRKTASGTFTIKSPSEEKRTVGAWVSIQENLELGPLEKKQIPFSVSIPANATPGTYAGGIGISPIRANTEVTSGAGAIIATRVVSPVFITIPGTKTYDYSWSGFSQSKKGGYPVFNASLTNHGNTIIGLEGTIDIYDHMGGKVKTIEINEVIALPDDTINISRTWQDKRFAGYFSIEYNLSLVEKDYANNQDIELEVLTQKDTMWVIPWTFIIVLLVIIAALIGWKMNAKKKEKQFMKSLVTYTVQKGETINDIAKKTQSDWKVLAKVNKLAAPYELKENQTLRVPPRKDNNEKN